MTWLKEATENRSFGEGSPVYSPNRDVLNTFPLVVNEIWDDIVAGNEYIYPKLAQRWKFNTSRILEAYNAYVDALSMFRYETGSATFDEAAVSSGFSELDPRLRLMLEAAVGRYMAGIYFYAIKDVTAQGEDPPPYAGYDTLQTIASEIKVALDGVETELAKRIKEHRSLLETEKQNGEGEGPGESENRPELEAEGEAVREGAGGAAERDVQPDEG